MFQNIRSSISHLLSLDPSSCALHRTFGFQQAWSILGFVMSYLVVCSDEQESHPATIALVEVNIGMIPQTRDDIMTQIKKLVS